MVLLLRSRVKLQVQGSKVQGFWALGCGSFDVGVFAYLDVGRSMSESSLTWTFVLPKVFACSG